MWILAILLLAITPCLAASADLQLSVKGKATAAIVVAPDAIPAEQTAAKELATHLKQVTGADFPLLRLQSGAAQPGPIRIHIGQSEAVKQLLPASDFAKLGKDGILIRRVGSDLILAGDRPRGTLYAVYTFLEDQVGCKWWTADASYSPKKPSLRVRVKDVTYTPPFRMRETYYQRVISKAPEFCARLKLNGQTAPMTPEWGGHYSIVGFVHTFNRLITPEKYFADHPEWFSLFNGQRTHEDAQLCLTNEEMRKELVKNALEWIKKEPEAGMISISQNDCGRPCQCPNCQAVVDEEGSQSGPVIRFVNAVAEDIEKEYPDFLVETLAYQYTRKAPAKTKPRHNVLVRLCSIECDFAKPLTSESNKTFYTDIKAWQAISPQLFVWDYTVNFMNLMGPHPNFRSLAPNVRLFAKSNVIGLFEQGDGYNPDANFAPMKIWLIAHLMWNPNANESKLMDEFLNGYYGAGGKYLRQYIDLICDSVKATDQLLPWDNKNYSFLSPEVIIKAHALFDSAEQAVKGDDELLKRIKLQRAAVYMATLIVAPAEGLPSGKELEQIHDTFMTLADTSGNIYKEEGKVMWPEYRQFLKDKSLGKLAYWHDGRKASDLKGYSDEETFAEMRQTMTEVFDFPKEGWRFKRDEKNTGAANGWYKADFDDSKWREIGIGKFFEEYGEDYGGYCWYRLKFTAPSIDPGKTVFLCFGGVDDSGIVWLNDQPVGEHSGWDKPFALDVTQVLRPGQENTLAVQVRDGAGNGGIYKSVKLMVR